MSTAYLPMEGLGEPGTGKAFKRSGRGGATTGRDTPFTHSAGVPAQSKGDSVPAVSTSPQRPLRSTTEGSCLEFPGEDAPSTERGVGLLAMPAAQGPGAGVRPQLGGHTWVPFRLTEAPRAPGATWGPAWPQACPAVYLPLLVPSALGGPRAAHGLGLRAVYELQQVLHPAMVDHTLPFRELVRFLRLLFLPLGQP